MKYCPLYVLIALVVPSLAFAQVTGGPNTFGYEYNSVAVDFVTAPAVTSPGPTSDDGEVTVTLPWSFEWFGTSYSSVTIGDNGGVTFQPFGSVPFSNSCLPALFATTPEIGVFWDDLNVGLGGSIESWHDTTADNDRFIISWDNVSYYMSATPSNGGSFQIHLEPGGAVELHWDDTNFGDSSVNHGASATIHIDDGFGGDPLQFSCDTPQSLEGTALRFSTCEDSDGDGYADEACGGDDCDDSEALINPGILETCENGTDEDCDGLDNDLDFDGDTYDSIDCVGGDDCDDTDPNINPSVDADGDGFNVCEDCNDTPGVGAYMFPGNPEICGDGVDQDCSGADDLPDVDLDGYDDVACGGDDCDDTDPNINVGVDVDGDGSNACEDCNDSEATALPGGNEICDGLDNDCDGNTDDVDADGDGDYPIACGGGDCDDNDPNVGANTDADGDTFNACDDCDDSDPAIYPGAPEACDDVDTDCDGLLDGQDADVGGSSAPPVSATGTTGFIFNGLPNPFVGTVSGGTADIIDVNVTVSLTVDYTDLITLTLSSPAGTSTVLTQGAGGSIYQAGFVDTVFDDDASTVITDGLEPFTGNFQPVGDLGLFAGEDPNGTWILTVTTSSFSFMETLDEWTLDIELGTIDDADGDGWVVCGDCDDTDSTVYPGAPEICQDGIDQDCDSVDATGDLDGDGYIDATCGGDDCDDSVFEINPGVDADGDGSNACDDCNDDDATILPGMPEVCGDGIDQNCNGFDDVPDVDGDGYIDVNCDGGDDCDDTNSLINPSVDGDGDGSNVCEDCNDNSDLQAPDLTEVCGDFIDNDCDDLQDNVDADGDGYTDEACGGEDCDDSDPAVNPDLDADGDGANACEDCDDSDPAINPEAEEICGDGIDQDCSGADLESDVDGDGAISTACGGDDCDDTDEAFHPDAEDLCDGVDLNCDGKTTETDLDNDTFYDADCGGLDCDDDAQSVHPGVVEVCNGIDDNCDEQLLDGGEDDLDEDGFPTCDDDCDDSNADVHPEADEICDDLDNDCDGEIDEGLVLDADSDGYIKRSCGGDDCNDSNSSSHPGATEDCTDGDDNDCDELTDTEDDDCDFGGGPSCGSCNSSGAGLEDSSSVLGLLVLLLGFVRRSRLGGVATR